jgi:hypothetical protein
MGGHGAGAGVGEQIDQDIVGGEEEEIVVGGGEELLALLARGPTDGLDAFDAEWFDDSSGDRAPRKQWLTDHYPLATGSCSSGE